MKKFIQAVAVALSVPIAAGATTVAPGGTLSAGDGGTSNFSLASNATAAFDYNTNGWLRVSIISVSGTDFNGGADLSKVLFGVGTANTAFSSVTDNGATGSASGSIGSFVAKGPFAIDFSALGTTKSVNLSYTFAVSAVPVPATGFLLLGGIGAFGALRRRKKKATA